MAILPEGEYSYETRRHGEVIETEEASFAADAIRGIRHSADGTNLLKVDASLGEDAAVQRVRISYSRGFFKRDAVYEADGETLRGSVSAMAGRNEIIVKLGRLREIDAELTLFRALLIARVRARGPLRWTGRVAVIDAATLVAASLKQSCRALDATGWRWLYEARMGDSETITLDPEGRITERRASDGTLTQLAGFTPAISGLPED
jgi:hypothetical protein